ncbi:MAG: hypothetical protein WEB53_16220 [Akkermansiaceae bacterium]
MKTILSIFLATVAIAFAENPRQLLTLEDIRTESIMGEIDPFGDAPKQLKIYESGLVAANGLNGGLDKETIKKALETAIEELRWNVERRSIERWNDFEAPFSEAIESAKALPEFTGNQAKDVWAKSPWRHTTPSAKDGRLIEWAKVRKVTPLGVSLMTEGGFKWISFSELNDDFDDVFGWSEDMEKESLESRSKADAEASMEIAKAEAAIKTSPRLDQPKTSTSVSARIKSAAQAKWKDNFQMVKYEIENQEEAYQEYLRHAKSNSPTMKTIVRNALEKWQENWRMVVYEIENQSEAKREIDGR